MLLFKSIDPVLSAQIKAYNNHVVIIAMATVIAFNVAYAGATVGQSLTVFYCTIISALLILTSASALKKYIH